MVNKQLDVLMARVDHLSSKMEEHLEDAGNVRTNIEWLKKWTYVSIGATVTTLGTLVVNLLMKK